MAFYKLRMTWTNEGGQNSLPESTLREFIKTTKTIGLGEGAQGAGRFKKDLRKGDIVAVFSQFTTPLVLTKVIDEKEQDYTNSGNFPTIDDWLFKVRNIEILSWYKDDKDRLALPVFSTMWPESSFAIAGQFLPPITEWYDKVMKDLILKKTKQTLLATHNIILTGAPGTGKTFLAKKIAYEITGDSEKNSTHISFCQFHPSYDYTDFVEGIRPTPPEDGKLGFHGQDGVFKAFCKRAINNQTSNFEDAYRKLCEELDDNYSQDNPLELKTGKYNKPFSVFLNSNGSLSLITGGSKEVQGSLTPEKMQTFLTPSPYKYWKSYFCGVLDYMKQKHGLKTTKDNSNQKYVFIIDEINRGDIAKIFGELFYAIDPDYRGRRGAIKTQYANLFENDEVFEKGMFFVPENVYIIGTMNDIDRNVESMDFAIRRRFTWIEIKPEETQNMLDTPEMSQYAQNAKNCMNAINEKIRGTEGLGPAYQLGAAYFLKLKNYEGDFDQLWMYNIGPLLHEYLRGMPKGQGTWDKLHEIWKNCTNATTAENNATSPTNPEEALSSSEINESISATDQQ